MMRVQRAWLAVVACALLPAGLRASPGPQDAGNTTLFTPAVVDGQMTAGMVRVAGRVGKDASPVLVGTEPWEQSLFFYHCIVEPSPGLIWLYYSSWTEHGAFVMLATSTDGGRTFVKPDLGVVSYDNSTANNIVLALTLGKTLKTFGMVFVDARAGVPVSERFKMTIEHDMNTGMDLWSSPDGLHWRELVPDALPSWFADTQPVVFWDPRGQQYLAYGRLHAGTPPGTGKPRACGAGAPLMRQVGMARTTGANVSAWGPVTEVFGFANQSGSACVDVYNSAAVAAANAYFMVPSEYLHFAPEQSHAAYSTNDGVLDIRLAVSSDGESFEYVSDETFVDRGAGSLDRSASGPDWHYQGDWDSGIIFAVRGYIETNSSLHLFYWGTQRTHGDYGKMWEYRAAASGIGRLTLRKDGWFSWNTVDSGVGVLVTKALALPQRRSGAAASSRLIVLLNVLSSVRGTVHASLLDAASGAPLPGYGRNSSVALVGTNSLSARITWTPSPEHQMSPPVPLSARQTVRLRLEATHSQLFAFRLAWDAAGAGQGS